VCAQSWQLDRK